MKYGLIKDKEPKEGKEIVLDSDCMATKATTDYKYLILRPDCKLYSKWEDKGSLIF